MEKNNLKIGDLVYVTERYGYWNKRELIDEAKKIVKGIKVKDFLNVPVLSRNEKYEVEIFKVIYTSGDYAFISDKYDKYRIYSYTSLKKLPIIGDKVKFQIDGQKEEYGIVRGYAGALEGVQVGDIINRLNTSIGVEFENKKDGRHDLGGTCKAGYGWYCEPEWITVITTDEKQDEQIQDNSEEIKKLAEEVEKLTKENARLTKTIERKERIQDLLNEAVIDKAKDIAVEDFEERLKENLDKFIQNKYGVLPKQIEVVKDGTKKELTGIFHKEFENICNIVNSDIPLMLVGSAGAGKNFTLEQVAEALDLDFYFSNAVNQEYKLTGFIDANGKYHETQFYQAFTKGGMFFLDEIDASCPECLVILNSAIANRYFDFPTGRVKAHENFRVVCAGNTYGTGADMVYVGRNVLDGATLDRFVVLQFDYDDQVEKQLAYDDNLYHFIKALRDAINKANLRYIVSMRALINATKLLKIGVSKDDILKTTIIKNMQIDDLNTIVNEVTRTYSSDWTDSLKRMCDNVRN